MITKTHWRRVEANIKVNALNITHSIIYRFTHGALFGKFGETGDKGQFRLNTMQSVYQNLVRLDVAMVLSLKSTKIRLTWTVRSTCIAP